jgi:pto-interacting protein 1
MESDVISSLLFQGVRKGLKDSATVKAEPQDSALSIDIPVLSLDELIEKTDDFGATALIGEGSYGRVYYAVLDTGTKMAVKKLDSTENETSSEFLTQVVFAIKD